MLYSNYRGVINWIDNLFIRDIRMGSIPFSTTIIRKSIMKNKLTLIKVCNKDYKPSASDLEHWRDIFDKAGTDPNFMIIKNQAIESGKISVETFDSPEENEHTVTFVKVGSDQYRPTENDLDAWREVFEAASADPDFKIFTYPNVEINIVPLIGIVAIE